MAGVGWLASGDDAELLEYFDAVVESDFLSDQPVLDFAHGRAGEPHRVTGGRGHRSDGQIGEVDVAAVSADALPLTHDVCTLGDQIGGSPGVEIGERRSEAGGELADLVVGI